MRRVEHVMGTVFSFDIRTSADPTSTLDEVVAWLHWVDAVFSPFRPSSQISRLRQGVLLPTQAHPTVRHVLDDMTRLSAATDGYFSSVPSGALDPCGYVKGWSVEQASAMLRAAGFGDHVVNGGGDVRTSGRPGARSWGVGIADPFRPGAVALRLDASDLAVATSGLAERGAHVVDPHDGRPAVELASLTVVGPDAGTADAYATAGVAMGRRARAWFATVPDYVAYGIAADGSRWTAGAGRTRPLSAPPVRRPVPPWRPSWPEA